MRGKEEYTPLGGKTANDSAPHTIFSALCDFASLFRVEMVVKAVDLLD
jgi:hypothetical protein